MKYPTGQLSRLKRLERQFAPPPPLPRILFRRYRSDRAGEIIGIRAGSDIVHRLNAETEDQLIRRANSKLSFGFMIAIYADMPS